MLVQEHSGTTLDADAPPLVASVPGAVRPLNHVSEPSFEEFGRGQSLLLNGESAVAMVGESRELLSSAGPRSAVDGRSLTLPVDPNKIQRADSKTVALAWTNRSFAVSAALCQLILLWFRQ